MGFLDWFRRRQGEPTESSAVTAEARTADQGAAQPKTADELEELAHEHRDEQVFREPRKPPGTG